ncbi:STAS domain-containing protein [Streptomyces sp. NPDC058989]|uniref:STAS domain-containing protein n=1 Tax=Streptomyces sp. NPDC058989 TaxID=3346686 RepID=UPI0036B15454
MPNEFPAGEHHGRRDPQQPDSRLRHPFRRRASGAEPAPDHVTVRLPRKVTIDNVDRIKEELRQALSSGPLVLEVDLARVTRLGRDGGAVFLTALQAAKPHGTRLIATHVGPQPLSALKQLGLRRLVDMYEGDATGSTRPPPSGRGEE